MPVSKTMSSYVNVWMSYLAATKAPKIIVKTVSFMDVEKVFL